MNNDQENGNVYLVSAIVSTYNAEKFLAGCLEDLEAQTISDKLEIIVVDTGSLQNERTIVEKFQARYRNIRYLRVEHRETVYQAWNRGIKVARGKYLTNANTDDRHRVDALEKLTGILEDNSEFVLAYGDCFITKKENERFEDFTQAGYYRWPNFSRKKLLKSCVIGPQPVWRRSIHEKCGYFDEAYKCGADYEFWLRIAEKNNFIHISDFIGLFYYNENTISMKGDLPKKEMLLIQSLYRQRYSEFLDMNADEGDGVQPLKTKISLCENCRNDETLNIVHIGTLERSGGAARVALRLRQAQQQNGHNVDLLVGRKETEDVFSHQIPHKIAVNLLDQFRQEGLLYYEFQGSHFLTKHPLIQDADIVHLHNLHGGYFNPFSLILLGRYKPVIWTLHDMQALTGHCAHSFTCELWQNGCENCPSLGTYPELVKDSTSQLWDDKKLIYDHVPFQVVTPSKWLGDMTMKGVMSRHPARVIANGVNIQSFSPKDKLEARLRLGIKEDVFVVGGVALGGALQNTWKGGEFAIAAFKKVMAKFPDSYFLSVGGQTFTTELDGHVINLPSVDDEKELAWIYAAMDVYLMTSIAESFSLTVAESMACGRPVLAFATGAVPELVRNGVNGIVVGYLDTEALSETLLYLVENQSLLDIMGVNARKIACLNYDHDLISNEYEAIYREYREVWKQDIVAFPELKIESIPWYIRTDPFVKAMKKFL